MLNQLKMYIRPEMYVEEFGLGDDKTGRTNSEFEQHSQTARMTGKPLLSKEMKEAVRRAWEGRERVRGKSCLFPDLQQPKQRPEAPLPVGAVRQIVLDPDGNVIHETVVTPDAPASDKIKSDEEDTPLG